ncbi:hypothetical protein QQS21_004373 [Conoideocrella luteorostrata]|uniref:FAD dependent oxidoreductase domain-containing protein n=1 Tax=Conoideocrella luteorostrata TaxID=1105319 RepID=A0AAJ0CRG0_9HYPO|nr:hypothetical protein QQS21_004373 [Conoideocrella luteorostrata]
MTSPISQHSAPIAIVGAGVFGLSTALHLARRGYTNVKVFDKQPYDETLYSYADGCDSASADINKLIRSAYGGQKEYQDLGTEAIALWDSWNEELKSSGASVPPGMALGDDIWINNGVLSCSDAKTLTAFDKATVDAMEAAGHHKTQLITSEFADRSIADARGLGTAMQPFSKNIIGVLDTTGGLIKADKACRFALHKAKSLGVRFFLDPEAGAFDSFLHGKSEKYVTGIKTADGKSHEAFMTIMACGGWTPSILPSLDGLCETTAGSVFMFKIPENSDLRARFHHSNFPNWMFNVRSGAEGGLYGFPIDESGVLKIGYRGTKYTNPVLQPDGIERSVPITRWTQHEKITQVPEQAQKVVAKFIDEYLPELRQEGIDVWMTRLCWYTDTFDNHYVIDRVQGFEGLMCATGGSGHAFKFLPNIGDWVVDIMEGVRMERPAVKAWAWRSLRDGQIPANYLMEGSTGAKSLKNVTLVSRDTWSEK